MPLQGSRSLSAITITIFLSLLMMYGMLKMHAEPLVKAFANCKIILTTRMNDIEQYLPSIQSLTIDPMTQSEASSLLTNIRSH